MLRFETIKLIEADLEDWKVSGSIGFPAISPVTIAAVDADTHGRGTRIVNILNATPINWSQLLAVLLPLLVQLMPLLIKLLGGG